MAAKNMTDTFCRNVKAVEGKRVEYKDGRTEGLYLVVQPTGSKGWVWRYRRPADSKPDKISLGAYPAFSLDDARDWADENNAIKEKGADPKIERAKAIAAAKKEAEAKAADDRQTLRWFWTTYYLDDFVMKLKQPREELRYWEKFVEPWCGDMTITEIDHDHLAALIDNAKTHAPVTAFKLIGFMKTMWKRMLTNYRHLVVNRVDAAAYLTMPSPIKIGARALDKREVGYALSVINRYCGEPDIRSNHRTFAHGLRLIIATGCRLNEAFAAEWAQFNLEQGFWLQPGNHTKNGFPNLLFLPAPTLEILRRLKAERPDALYPFAQKNSDKPLNALSKSMELIFSETAHLAKADGFDMEPWSCHDLRRTMTTGFQQIFHPGTMDQVVPDPVVEAIVNHVDGSKKSGVKKHYNHYKYAAEKAEGLKVWQAYLDEAAADEAERAATRKAPPPVPRTRPKAKAATAVNGSPKRGRSSSQ